MLVEAAIALDVKPDTPRAIALAERACELAGTDGDRPELEAVNALLTVRTSTRLPPDEMDLSLVLRAAELVEQPELRQGSEEVHWIAYCLALHERDDEARRLSDRSLTEARANGDVWSLCFGLYARAAIEQATGRIDAAPAWVSEAVQLAEQIGEPWRIAEAYGVLARDRVRSRRRCRHTSGPRGEGAPLSTGPPGSQRPLPEHRLGRRSRRMWAFRGGDPVVRACGTPYADNGRTGLVLPAPARARGSTRPLTGTGRRRRLGFVRLPPRSRGATCSVRA